MMFIDFHTHLDLYKFEELDSQLSEFCGTIISAAMDKESYLRTIDISSRIKSLKSSVRVIPTFGIHPARVLKVLSENSDLSRFDDLCMASPIIGEIGMDLCWYKDASVEQQEYVLRYFMNHCNQHKKYCVIHTKDAEALVEKILLDYPNAKPIIHWYDGPEDIYKRFIEQGYYFTFGCETSRSKHIQNLLAITPKDKILAETDNPESEPWLGGSDFSVNLIKRIYSDIGKVLNINDEEAAKLINENSNRILEFNSNCS